MIDTLSMPCHVKDVEAKRAQTDGYTDACFGYSNKCLQSPTFYGTFYRLGYREGKVACGKAFLERMTEKVKYYISQGIVLTFPKKRVKLLS